MLPKHACLCIRLTALGRGETTDNCGLIASELGLESLSVWLISRSPMLATRSQMRGQRGRHLPIIAKFSLLRKGLGYPAGTTLPAPGQPVRCSLHP